MKVASAAEVKSHFSAYLKASAEGPVIVTLKGKAVAVLVSVNDEDELERLDDGPFAAAAGDPGSRSATY